MSKTNNTTTLEIKIANGNMREYLKLQAEKAVIDSKMKAHKALLLEYAEKNRDFVDGDNNLHLEEGYLHFGNKSVVKTSPKFDLLRFVKFFPELLKREFKVSAIKAILADARGKQKLQPHGISIVEVEEFSIVPKKKSDE
jgi:hypothetical protein